jgi:hypothetical protein
MDFYAFHAFLNILQEINQRFILLSHLLADV